MLIRAKLSEQIAANILSAILGGQLAPGSLLPSEPELARQYGVSRPALREALRILATQGVVRSEHGRGVIVLEHTGRPLLDQLTLSAWRLHVPTRDLWEARHSLESSVVDLAAIRRSNEDLAGMTAALDRMWQHYETTGGHDVEADAEFHRSMVAAAHNEFLSMIMESVTQLYRAVAHSLRILLDSKPVHEPEMVHEWLGLSCATHQRLRDQLADANPAGARQALEEHWQLSYAMWGPYLGAPIGEMLDTWPDWPTKNGTKNGNDGGVVQGINATVMT